MSFIVTQSSLRTWRRCRKQADYKYVQQLRPRKVERPLAFGSAVHKILEYRLAGKTTAEAIQELNKKRRPMVFAAELDHWDEIHRDAEAITNAYMAYWATHGDKLTPVKINGQVAEHKFEYDLGQDISLQGVIDVLPQTPDKRVWVMEHKSRGGRIEDDSVRTRDVQTMLYSRVAEGALGVKRIAGVMWDYLRSKSPTVPHVLKDGTLSKRAIDTLPSVYEAEIERLGLRREHYADILGGLDDGLKGWFRRVVLPTNKDAINTLVEESLTTGREMKRKLGVDTTRNLTRDCSWCSYEPLCKAELFGLDASFIRSREYRVDDKAHPELEVEPD